MPVYRSRVHDGVTFDAGVPKSLVHTPKRFSSFTSGTGHRIKHVIRVYMHVYTYTTTINHVATPSHLHEREGVATR